MRGNHCYVKRKQRSRTVIYDSRKYIVGTVILRDSKRPACEEFCVCNTNIARIRVMLKFI